MAKGYLEVFKFGCYIAIPIFMTAAFVTNPDRLAAIIKNRAYVVYPPESQRPPSYEELVEQRNKPKKQ
ncbi:hypothetical protein ABBQ32_008482 [Trebouxia sp. C0010 RCD-2024]